MCYNSHMATEEMERFGDHFLGDHCQDTVSLKGFWGLPKGILLGDLVSNYYVDRTLELYRKYRFQALKRFSEERRVKDYLSSFILTGGTQQEPLNTLSEPALFDHNNFPPGTVVRLVGPMEIFQDEDSTELLWREKDKIRGFPGYNYRFISANHISVDYKCLAVVTRAFSGKGNILACSNGKEEVIAKQKAAVLWVDEPLKLGVWEHTGMYGLRFPFSLEERYTERFGKITATEVLEVGQGVSEKVETRIPNLIPTPAI